eukprot:scaffold22653_cov53-Attheya_sp.AAC.4
MSHEAGGSIMSNSTGNNMNSSSRQSLGLNVGTRVTVYWSDDDEWYKGTVATELLHDDDRVRIEYDDGESDWMDITADRWGASSKPDTFLKHDAVVLALKREKVAKLNVGSRISVWWPQEKEYYTGTLTKIDDDSKNHPHHVQYDDGEEEKINLLRCKFKRVEAKAERLHVGSRVSVYKEQQDRHFCATITSIKCYKTRPHRVKFDDESQGKEWLNLHVHPFLDIDPPMPKSTSTDTVTVAGTGRPTGTLLPCTKANASNLMKRKREFLDLQPSNNSSNKKCITREQKRTKDKEEEAAQTAKQVCEEICVICKSRAKHPQAMSCHHIFCKRCIKKHDSRQQHRLASCPLCKITIVSKGVKYDPDHVSFKAVEALKRTTVEVAHIFSSASAASLESRLELAPSCIVEACQSKQRDSREYHGFYWRFQDCKDRILRVGESVNNGIPIEQVDAQTGKIIETFSSSRKAYEKTNVSRCIIKRFLERRGKVTAGGSFWRFQGETHGPWPDLDPTNLNPVEQLDFETGDFLKSYVSIAEAKRAFRMRVNSGCIRDVCDGKGRATTQGYFWRWKGSQALPNHMMGVQKILQMSKTKNGKVVKEFRTSRDAQAYFGHQCCWSTLCRYCREVGFYNGYYWQYRMLKEPKSAEEAMVGKRLRVLQPGNRDEWLEGKIEAFHSETGKHEIRFDNGTMEQRKLEDIRYEWKNDQGKNPVEQLDVKTGEVLATFNSISSAAASVPGSRPSAIASVCTGRCKSSFGFFWRYKGSDALPPIPKGKRKVEQLCLKTGRVVATFDSIAAAGKAIGFTAQGISYCCNGRNSSKSAGGFGWRFVAVD